MGTRTEEKNIIRKIDDVIELLIEISGDSGDIAFYRKQAIEKCCDLIPMLLPFLDGNNDHLESFIFQLVKERLPNWNIISTFGNLQEELDTIISNSIKMYFNQENIEEEFTEEKEECKSSDNIEIPQTKVEKKINNEEELKILQLNLLKLLPKEEIIFNYFLGGKIIDAFLPDKKIAFVTKKVSPSLNFISCKKGIKIFFVPKNIQKDYRKLWKFIKQI